MGDCATVKSAAGPVGYSARQAEAAALREGICLARRLGATKVKVGCFARAFGCKQIPRPHICSSRDGRIKLYGKDYTQAVLESSEAVSSKFLKFAENQGALININSKNHIEAHTLQLEAFSVAIRKLDEGMRRPKLQFVGSCRNKADEERLQKLRDLAIELEVQEDVQFYKNLMHRALVEVLGSAVAGIHSMTDEHFGICVVEYMAAGAIPIAHNSAGPKMDIKLEEDGQPTGFLAQTVEEYADAILRILRMSEDERLTMAAAARRWAARFSEQRFYKDLKAAVRAILFSSTDEQ